MIRSTFVLFLAVNVVTIDCTTVVNYIYNATYISKDTTAVITYKNTCSECICYAFFSSVPPSYVGLNCYKSNKTCVLFANYSSPSTIKINLNSTFIFTKQPPLQNTTTAPPVLLGLTVAGYGNGTPGNDTTGLFSPMGISVMPTGEFYVADANNNRVQHFMPGSLIGQTVAGNMTAGSDSSQLSQPVDIYVDPLTRSVYVADSLNNRVQLWVANAAQGQTIIGTLTWPSTYYITGIQLDAQGQIYVADYANSRVIHWSPNRTNGTVIAGTGTSGSNNRSLTNPEQLDLDASGEYLYIADKNNHRIQQWKLPSNGSAPATAGVTVAGGHGPGLGATQLNYPYAVYVSKITGTIYVADTNNHRIQRWAVGATQGETIAGIGGSAGIGPAQLNQPAGVALDPAEIYLYVADEANHRVQRFTLI